MVGCAWPQVVSQPLFAQWTRRAAYVAKVVLVLSVLSAIFTVYYAGRKMIGSDQPLNKSQEPPVTAPLYTSPATKSAQSHSTSTAPNHVQPKSKRQLPNNIGINTVPVDWHDKQNWRRHLHTGMSRSEVRALFGEPEVMGVSGGTEFWEYGHGQITFDMESHKDGSLYSWDEPK